MKQAQSMIVNIRFHSTRIRLSLGQRQRHALVLPSLFSGSAFCRIRAPAATTRVGVGATSATYDGSSNGDCRSPIADTRRFLRPRVTGLPR